MSMLNTENPRFIELKAQGRLPSIKGVALSILETTANEDVSLPSIAKIITPDPALTARLIKISNSVLYPGARPVAALKDALVKLGLSQVRQIALGFALVAENKEGSCIEFDYPGFWAKSIIRASLMRQACLSFKLGSAEEMFTLGLLAKVGDLALATAYPEKYASLLKSNLQVHELRVKEREAFGLDAPLLSAALMDDWKLPPPFARAAKLESQYLEAEEPRIKGLFELMRGAEEVAMSWMEKQDLTPEERAEALAKATQSMLEVMLEAGGKARNVTEEDAKTLAEISFEEGVGWLESLSILPQFKAPKERAVAKATAAKAMEDEPLEVRRPLAEEMMEPRVMSEPVRALAGCSDPASIKTIAQALSMRSAHIVALRNKDQLFEELIEFAPHLLFLDYEVTPQFNQMLESIRETELGKSLLIVLVCRPEHENRMGEALSNGADDYLVRPFSLAQANAKVATAERLAAVSLSMRESRESIKRYALELESVNKKLQHTALNDHLTGLPNRLLFQDRLEQAIAGTLEKKEKTALMIIDLDHFKNINDAFGHPIGDEVLRTVAERLKPMIKVSDSLARMGGDEFTMILRDVKDMAEAQGHAKKVLEKIGQALKCSGKLAHLTASIGIAMCPEHGEDVGTLVKHADLALYKAKQEGTSSWHCYTAQLSEAVSKRYSLESALNKAFEREEFEVHFQPRVDLATRKMVGAEALLRWKSAEMGMIPPEIFIPIAEDNGLIDAIGTWVLKQTLKIAKPWLALDPTFQVAVNLSARQFKGKDLSAWMAEALSEAEYPARNLEVEITESAAMEDIFMAGKALSELKRLGLAISLDDFGTGYSSLAYLKKLPIDTLKIDKSFIVNALTDKDDAAISKMIAALAKTMGKGLVAEGIETAAHAEFSKELGVKYGQGFLYSKAVPARELEGFFGKVWA